MTALLVVLIILIVLILWQLLARLIRRYVKFPAPAFISTFLDSRFRKELQPPARVISDCGIRPGMSVLEIGCGSGAFTLAAARAAGNAGKIMALDIQQDMLAKLKQKLLKPENSDIRNVEIINRSAYDLPLEPGSIDLVFMVTVLQEVPDKPRVLHEIKRVLRPGGTLAVSEFIIDPDYPWRSTTEQMVKKAGFAVDGHSGNLWSYTVRFSKP
jgi:ubiquinone/menaquinone biosynthesis C-methylase UbiE